MLIDMTEKTKEEKEKVFKSTKGTTIELNEHERKLLVQRDEIIVQFTTWLKEKNVHALAGVLMCFEFLENVRESQPEYFHVCQHIHAFSQITEIHAKKLEEEKLRAEFERAKFEGCGEPDCETCGPTVRANQERKNNAN